MCGLVYIETKDQTAAAHLVRACYEKQKSRGQQGYGFVAVDKDNKPLIGRSEGEAAIMAKLMPELSTAILFHHRMPTSTPNVIEGTHPIIVMHKSLRHDYAVIHNGVIYNCDSLKRGHDEDGYKYTTLMQSYIKAGKHKSHVLAILFNDSESVSIEMAKAIDAGTGDLEHVQGWAALMCFQFEKGTHVVKALYYCTDDHSPMKKLDTEAFLKLSSQGEGEHVPANILFRRDWTTKATSERPFQIGHKPVKAIMGFDANSHNRARWGYDREDDAADISFSADGTRHEAVTPDEMDDPMALVDTMNDMRSDQEELLADYEQAVKNQDTEEAAQLEYELAIISEDISFLQDRLKKVAEDIAAETQKAQDTLPINT